MKLEIVGILVIIAFIYYCNNSKYTESFETDRQQKLSAEDKLKVDKLLSDWLGAWHPIIRRGCVGQEICAEGREGGGSDLIQKKTLENLLNLVKNAQQTRERVKLHMNMLKDIDPWSAPGRGLSTARGYIGSISLWTHLGGNDSDPDNTTIDFMKGMNHAENHVREKLTYYLTKFPVDEAAAATAAAPEGLPRRHHVYLHRWKLGHMAKNTQYFKDLKIEKNGVISYKDFFEKECIPELTERTPDGPNKEKNIENKCLELWRSYLGPEKQKISDTEIKKSTSKIKDLVKYAWMNSNSRKLFMEKNIKAPSDQNTTESKDIKPVQKQVVHNKPEVVQSGCNGPPACKTNATKTLDEKGKQVFTRCKSGCGTKIAKLGYICCDTGCCNNTTVDQPKVNINLPDNSLEKTRAIETATKNIDIVKKIGTHLDTNDIPDADMKEANMYMNTINMITSQIAGVRGSLNKMTPQIMGIMDTDNSTKISKEELLGKLPLLMKNIDVAIDYGFKQLDTNNSGGIEKKELNVLRQTLNTYANDALNKTYSFVDKNKSKDITTKEIDGTLKIIGKKWDRVAYMTSIILKLIHDKNTTSSTGEDVNRSIFVDKKPTENPLKNKDFSNEVDNIKKTLLAQEETIKQLEGRVTDTNNKFYASANNRDAKLLEANDGATPMNPSNFSYKPKIKFSHKQPSAKVASAYGWSFMPPHFWSVPQKRPPACIPSPQNTATVTPIYDKSVPVDALDYTQVGSILPKFEYNEVYNPDYYYPGWIAKKKEPYPGKNGKAVMKSGEYYSMRRATSTGLKPFGKKIVDEKIHPQTVIHKARSNLNEHDNSNTSVPTNNTPKASSGSEQSKSAQSKSAESKRPQTNTDSLNRKQAIPSRRVNRSAQVSNTSSTCKIIGGHPKFNRNCRTNASKTLDKDGKQIFKRCKSGCDTKIPNFGSVCCASDCCKAS